MRCHRGSRTPGRVAWLACLALGAAAAGCAAWRTPPPPQPFPRPFHLIAHRGASARAPENTLAAFRAARALGAFEVELDVQLSRDGVVVVYHDRHLEEKSSLHGSVGQHDAAELTKIDMGSWFDRTRGFPARRWAGEHVVTLAQVFDTFGPELVYHVELKSSRPELLAGVERLVRERDLAARVVLSSSFFDALTRARASGAGLPTCWIVGDLRELRRDAAGGPLAAADLLSLQRDAVDRAADAGLSQVTLPAEDVSPQIVAHARARGLGVLAYRVGDDALMRRALAAGVNGMTIDWPDRLIRALLEHLAQPGLD